MAQKNDESATSKHTHDVNDVESSMDMVDKENTTLEKYQPADEKPCHPVDRGWAWVVLGAAVFEVFVYGGMLRSYGIFFIQYQSRFQSSASDIAMMSTIQNLVHSFTGLLIMTLWLPRVSTRVTVAIGGSFTVAGYLITAYTKQLVVFYLAQGVLGGIGMAMVHPPIYAILGVYFKKHIGLGISIFTAGASVGGLVWAPILTKLLQEYGFSGAMLIVAGLLGNIIVAALLMRPTEAYTRKKKQKRVRHSDNDVSDREEGSPLMSNTVVIDGESSEVKNSVDHTQLEQQTQFSIDNGGHSQAVLQRQYSVEESRSNTSPLMKRLITSSVGNLRKRTGSESYERKIASLRNLETVIDAICRSEASVYSDSDTPGAILETIHDENETDTIESEDVQVSWCKKALTVLKTNAILVYRSLFDLSLLTQPVFILIVAMAFCMITGLPLSPIVIPPFAKDININDDKIALLISIHSVIDLVSRITLGFVADRKLMKRTTILAIAAVLIGTTWQLMGLVKTFTALLLCVIISGTCAGLYASVYAVIIVEFLGLAKLKSGIGFCTLCHGISIAVFFPIAGRLRDTTGTYIATYHLFGSMAYAGACFAVLIPLAHRWNEKRTTRADPERDSKH